MKRSGYLSSTILTLAALACLNLLAGTIRAADKEPEKGEKPPAHAAHEPAAKHAAFIDPDKAGPDYAVQGEYVGDVANGHAAAAAAPPSHASRLGVQVIALGDGKFTAVFLPGGLPGEGWDGHGRTEVPGEISEAGGGKAVFGGGAAGAGAKGESAYTATIDKGVLSGKGGGGESFELKKVLRHSPAENAKPPEGATVLFDGTNTDAWTGGKIDDRKLLMIGAETKKHYQNFVLHLEFILPFKPTARDQERGNSGIYIQRRYEVQVLDTFGHKPEFNGIGSLYRQQEPLLNMCYPPLTWQTYDIDFQGAKFGADGKKSANAVITVKLNGVVVQDHYEIKDKTGAGKPEGAEPGPIYLQDHGNPVFYRNIWIVEK